LVLDQPPGFLNLVGDVRHRQGVFGLLCCGFGYFSGKEHEGDVERTAGRRRDVGEAVNRKKFGRKVGLNQVNEETK
jgi:hypothetical protein